MDGAELTSVTRADLDKQPHEVAEMFDGVAKGYDLTNSVMTLGFDRRWRLEFDCRVYVCEQLCGPKRRHDGLSDGNGASDRHG